MLNFHNEIKSSSNNLVYCIYMTSIEFPHHSLGFKI